MAENLRASDPPGTVQDLRQDGPPDNAWHAAYGAACSTVVKTPEMALALDYILIRERGSARAVAFLNGGEYNGEHLRRIAAVEAARDAIVRIRESWGRFGEATQRIIAGLPPKKKNAGLTKPEGEA